MTGGLATAPLDRLRQMPHAIDAEQALLGVLLLKPEQYASVASIVRPEHFTEAIHRAVFEAIRDCREAGRTGHLLEAQQMLGVGTVTADLGSGVTLLDYARRLASDTTTVVSGPEYARAVRDSYGIRMLASIATEPLEPDASGLPDKKLADAFDRIDELRTEIAESVTTRQWIGSIGAKVLERSERIADGEEAEPGVTTGLPDLDRAMLGYRPGELVIVAGRPGMGKSTFGTSSALAAAAIEHGGRRAGVGFFALELGEEAIGARCLADLAYDGPHSPTHSAIRAGQLSPADRRDLHQAKDRLAARPVLVDGRSSASLGDIEAACLGMRRRFERNGQTLGVVIIDYLKQVRASDRYRRNRVYEISEIMHGMRDLAKRLGICVVLLVQLNRSVENRDDKRPTLADLRESGDIENDADVVLLLYRGTYYLQRDLRAAEGDKAAEIAAKILAAENELEILIPKNRNGEGEQVAKAFCDIGRSAVRSWSRVRQ